MALCQIWNSKVVIMKDLQKIFIILAILFAGGCAHSDDGLSAGQKGTLVVSLNTPIDIDVEQTRVDLGDGNLSDGGGMEDLLLVLVNPNNKVVAKKLYEYNTSTATWSGGELSAYEGNKSVTTSFTDLDVAIYKIYAYANINRSLSYFGDLETMLNNIVVGNDFTLADATFADLGNSTSTTAPTVDVSNPMLLTACDEVHIEVGTTQAVVEMLRPLVEFNFKVVNHSSKQLNVTNLKFKNFNPQTSYITPHDAIYAEDATNNIYRELPASGFSNTTPAVIAANGEAVVYKTYLYENTAPSNRYQFDIDLELPDVGYEGSTTVFAGLTKHTTALVANASYVFKNTAGNYYLIDNGGELAIVNEINNDNFLKAEFKFSTTTHGYLINEQSGNKFYRDTKAFENEYNLSLYPCNNGQYQIFYNSFYLKLKGSIVEYSPGEDNSIWQLYTVQITQGDQTQPIDPISAKNQQISYIQDNGVAAPLKEMLRNQKITVTLNVYYEETSGTLRFYIEQWNTGHNNGATFD
jgi:hypothetical protein